VRKRLRMLRAGGYGTAVASLLHIAIIVGGPAWYRFFGAGEHMALLAARGSTWPTLVTSCIAAILAVWAIYAFSGAGMIRRLPMLRLILALIAAIYLARGVLGVPVVLLVEDPYLDELKGRIVFMAVSSLACIALGLCYAAGAAAELDVVTDGGP
jgi:putative oxidoreductase